jgi:hypothetical protein
VRREDDALREVVDRRIFIEKDRHQYRERDRKITVTPVKISVFLKTRRNVGSWKIVL